MTILWEETTKGLCFTENGCKFEIVGNELRFTPPGMTLSKKLATIESDFDRSIAGDLAVYAIRSGVHPMELWNQNVVFASDDTAGIVGNYATMVFDRNMHVAIDFCAESKGYYLMIESNQGFSLWLHIPDDHWRYGQVRNIADAGYLVFRFGEVKRVGRKGIIRLSDLCSSKMLSQLEIEKLRKTLSIDENNRSAGNGFVGEDEVLENLFWRGYCAKTDGKCFPGDETVYYATEEVAAFLGVTNMEQIFDEYRRK